MDPLFWVRCATCVIISTYTNGTTIDHPKTLSDMTKRKLIVKYTLNK